MASRCVHDASTNAHPHGIISPLLRMSTPESDGSDIHHAARPSIVHGRLASNKIVFFAFGVSINEVVGPDGEAQVGVVGVCASEDGRGD